MNALINPSISRASEGRRPSPSSWLHAALLALAVGCATVASSGAEGARKPLRLSNATLPPVTTLARDGYLDRVMAEMFRRAGMAFELRKVPPARGLVLANAGLLDGDAARIAVLPGRFPNLLPVPEPVIDVVFAGLYKRRGVGVDTLEDFGRYRVGYVRGWKIAEALLADVPTAFPVRSAGQLLDMLEAERIDIAFLTVAPARHLARSKGIDGLQATRFAVRKDLFLYLHERHADSVPALVGALAAMKEDGSYRAIMDGYEIENR